MWIIWRLWSCSHALIFARLSRTDELPTQTTEVPFFVPVFSKTDQVYQMSTKKDAKLLYRRGWRLFQFLGRLPDVYQFNFFISKAAVFWISFRFLQSQNLRKWRDTSLFFGGEEKSLKNLGKMENLSTKSADINQFPDPFQPWRGACGWPWRSGRLQGPVW